MWLSNLVQVCYAEFHANEHHSLASVTCEQREAKLL
jgi:hypothetical protein